MNTNNVLAYLQNPKSPNFRSRKKSSGNQDLWLGKGKTCAKWCQLLITKWVCLRSNWEYVFYSICGKPLLEDRCMITNDEKMEIKWWACCPVKCARVKCDNHAQKRGRKCALSQMGKLEVYKLKHYSLRSWP